MNLHINKVLYILQKEYGIDEKQKDDIRAELKKFRKYSLNFVLYSLKNKD